VAPPAPGFAALATVTRLTVVVDFDPKASFGRAPVARLGTVGADGMPHLVPVVFALRDDVVFTGVDAKPKTTQRLRRLANIEGHPQVSLLVDHYADDWAQLWWVRVDGIAAIHRDGQVLNTGHDLLRAKYAQYQSVPLNGPVIAIAVKRWSSWHA
jgi:PPOX class probable F420-dependent enzyme